MVYTRTPDRRDVVGPLRNQDSGEQDWLERANVRCEDCKVRNEFDGSLYGIANTMRRRTCASRRVVQRNLLGFHEKESR